MVNRRRDLGGVVFIDLRTGRNRPGGLQPGIQQGGPHQSFRSPGMNMFIAGRAKWRGPEGTENRELKTGTFEIQTKDLIILSESTRSLSHR